MEHTEMYRYKPKFRHKLKYKISKSDYLAISRRIKPVMKTDAHSNENGRYTIYSFYFDNVYDKALLEKINGVQSGKLYEPESMNIGGGNFPGGNGQMNFPGASQSGTSTLNLKNLAIYGICLGVMLLFLLFASLYKRRPGKG